MDRAEISIREFLTKTPEEQTRIAWYDWFCREKSLLGKTKGLLPRIRKIVKLQEALPPKCRKVNIDNMYVWFKNNCPMSGSLYDDFRFADMASGATMYTITPKSGFTHKFGTSELWGKENEFSGPLVIGTWKDILDYFRR